MFFLKRKAIQNLIKWKSGEDRKPMVLKGAHQVGKTWLMKKFGQSYYENYVYFNLDQDDLKSIFEMNKNPYGNGYLYPLCFYVPHATIYVSIYQIHSF